MGVAANRQSYARARWFAVREIGATFKALLELIRHQPAPHHRRPHTDRITIPYRVTIDSSIINDTIWLWLP